MFSMKRGAPRAKEPQQGAEDDVYSIDFLKTTKKTELMSKLNELHRHLSTLSQDDEKPRGLSTMANQLVADKILGHADKDVRLMASCCLVDIFRVYVPDPPFGESDQVSVFEVIISQLRSLSTHDVSSGTGMKVFYILNSISTFKSCLIPVLLSQSNIPGASDLVTSMFDALVSSIRSEHPDDVMNQMTVVLQACIEESDDVDQDLLDILLAPLLPAAKAENPTAFKLVSNVLRKVTNHVQVPISAFINHVLVGTLEDGKGKSSELADHIYSLVYELHKISSGLLLRVLPNICAQLTVEEEEVRLKAVKLLGRLFASPHADYAVEFSRNFKDFLNRFVDVSVTIRLEMVDCSKLILKNKSALTPQVEELITNRINGDSDHEIRLRSLQCLLDATLINPCNFAVNTFTEMFRRVKDKRPEIRKAALTGMARLYYRHVAVNLPSLDTVDHSTAITDVIPEEILSRLSTVPRHIINCWSYDKYLVLQLIQEYLIPKPYDGAVVKESDNAMASKTSKKTSDALKNEREVNTQRATALLVLYSLLGDEETPIFLQILRYKNDIKRQLSLYLEHRGAGPDEDQETKMKLAVYKIAQSLPPNDKKNNFFDRVHSAKDKAVVKLLSKAVSPSHDAQSLMLSRDDLKQRLDSKSDCAEYIGQVYDYASFMIANSGVGECVLEYVIKLKDDEYYGRTRTLVMELARSTSAIFSSQAHLLQEWLEQSIKISLSSKQKSTNMNGTDLIMDCLEVIKLCGYNLITDDSISNLYTSVINNIAKHPSGAVCQKLSVTAVMLCLYSNHKYSSAKSSALSGAPLLNIMKTITKSLSIGNKRLGIDMSVLATLMNIPTITTSLVPLDQLTEMYYNCFMVKYQDATDKAVNFVQQLLEGSNEVSDVSELCAALKLWCNIIVSQQISTQTNLWKLSSDLFDINALVRVIFDCLESGGDKLGEVNISKKNEKLVVYETAASCGIQLMKLHRVGKDLSVDNWLLLAWSLLHENHSLKSVLFNEYRVLIQTCMVHPRFLAYSCLYADDEDLTRGAYNSLVLVARRLRKNHEDLLSIALSEDNEEIRVEAEQIIPESIFPYVLYLLSYHPNFPSTFDREADKKQFKVLDKSIKMMIDILLETLGNHADNISFLLKQIHMITQYYEDRCDPANLGLPYIAKRANQYVNEQIRTAENLQAYPGDVLLPMEIYQLSSAKNTSERNSILSNAMIESEFVGTKHSRQPAAPKVAVTKVSSASKITKEPKKKIVEEAPVRISGRAKRTSGSYKELEEDDKEVEMWERMAADKETNTRTTTSKSAVSANSNKMEESEDEGAENRRDSSNRKRVLTDADENIVRKKSSNDQNVVKKSKQTEAEPIKGKSKQTELDSFFKTSTMKGKESKESKAAAAAATDNSKVKKIKSVR